MCNHLAGDDVLGEGEDAVEGGLDLGAEEGVGGEAGVAEPVVANHAALVGVGDGALLEFPHRREGALHPRLHPAEELLREPHPAHVHEQAELLVLVQPLHVPLPQLDWVLFHRAARSLLVSVLSIGWLDGDPRKEQVENKLRRVVNGELWLLLRC
uniref:DUF834 domain-containing protein n=1 Tax=Oryza punctata TaxID=4537 RepID=A0A0E0M262_ORYPU